MSVEKRSLDITSVLLVDAGEARDGAKKRVSFARIVRCPHCFATYRTGPGCAECDGGLTTRDEAVVVTVPAGVAHGAELRLSGKGHESARDDTGDLYLVVTLPKEEPDPAALIDDERENGTRSASPAAPPKKSLLADPQARAFAVLGCLVLAGGLAVAALEAIERSRLSPVGALCDKGAQCASGLCMELYEEPQVHIFPGYPQTFKGLPRKTGSVCSEECKTDADCPSTMTCAPASLHQSLPGFSLGPGTPNTTACSPRPPSP